MKTALYIEDGKLQLVITPESEFEKNSLTSFYDKPLEAKLFSGSFYDCRGGWVMQTAYRERLGYGIDLNHQDKSLILSITEGDSK